MSLSYILPIRRKQWDVLVSAIVAVSLIRVAYPAQVMDRIQGLNGLSLPWEDENLTAVNKRRLGLFSTSLMPQLSRDPSKRPTMTRFCSTCNRVLSGSTTVQV